SVILIFKEQCLEGFSLFRFNFQRFKRSAHYTEVFRSVKHQIHLILKRIFAWLREQDLNL
ncbi:hypothetical protein ACFQ1T_14315, partial [Methylophilus glucosoxydans]